MKRIEWRDHTADVLLRASGDTLEEAYAAAADAMFGVITDPARIEWRETVEVTAESIDREGLLVTFLSELIARHEIERLVLKDFEVRFTGDNALTATAHGEPFDNNRHEAGMHVKAVSYHMIEIADARDGQPAYVQVLFDV